MTVAVGPTAVPLLCPRTGRPAALDNAEWAGQPGPRAPALSTILTIRGARQYTLPRPRPCQAWPGGLRVADVAVGRPAEAQCRFLQF